MLVIEEPDDVILTENVLGRPDYAAPGPTPMQTTLSHLSRGVNPLRDPARHPCLPPPHYFPPLFLSVPIAAGGQVPPYLLSLSHTLYLSFCTTICISSATLQTFSRLKTSLLIINHCVCQYPHNEVCSAPKNILMNMDLLFTSSFPTLYAIMG